MKQISVMKLFTLAIAFCFYMQAEAQSIGINTRTPDPSAALDIASDAGKGLLIPRMNSSERNAIRTPANGLLVYDVTTNTFWYYKSDTWIEITSDLSRQSMAGVFENNAGVVRNTGNHSSDDFVFGSAALPPATSTTDALYFFDKSKAAFRTGYISSNYWAPDSLGQYSFAAGNNAKAKGDASISMGGFTQATGSSSTAMGGYSKASGEYSTAMGYFTEASGGYSTAMGRETKATGLYSTAMGQNSAASGPWSTALGHGSISSASNSTAIGGSIASGINATAMGLSTEASGDYSTAMGAGSEASGDNSSAIGVSADAVGINSTSIGNHSIASGANAMALGYYTLGTGDYSTVMGYLTKASGNYATSMGGYSEASGLWSTAMGYSTTASSNYATALGVSSTASGYGSTSMGLGTKAESIYSTAIGRYNLGGGSYISWIATDPLFEIGNGSGPSTKNNALTILKSGNMGVKGNPDIDLHLYHGNSGTGSGMKLQNTNTSGNWIRMYVSSSDGFLRLFSKVNGTNIIGAFDDISGAYTALSDRRVKNDIQKLHFDWSEFMQLKPLTYQFNADNEHHQHIGMIAQDVHTIYPELVKYFQEEDLYHMDYAGFGVIAIKAVQELKKELDTKDALIHSLSETSQSQQKEIRALMDAVVELRAMIKER